MNNPLTASERRGILVVAALALLIIGVGWCVSTCRRPSASPSSEIEVLVNGDSVSDDVQAQKTSTSGTIKKGGKSQKDSLSGSKTKSTKTYRRRSPRDENV